MLIFTDCKSARTGSQPWHGTKGLGNKMDGLKHFFKELNIFRKDDDRVQQAAQDIREYYDSAVQEKQEVQ